MGNSINDIFERHWQRACNTLKSENTEIMIGVEADETIEELFEPLPSIYQKGLKNQWKVDILSLIILGYCVTNIVK